MSAQDNSYSLKRAQYLLRSDKPVDLTGGFKIKTAGGTVAIYGALKIGVGGNDTMHYTLKRPRTGTLYTKDWPTIVDEAIKEAIWLDTNVAPGTTLVLRNDETFRYKDLLAAITQSLETGNILKLLQATANLVPQSVPAINKLIQVVAAAEDSMDNLLAAVKSGIEFEAFKALRPYLEANRFLPVMEDVLPAMVNLPTNLEIVQKFLYDHRRFYRPSTFAQYELKLTRLAESSDKPFIMMREDDITKHIEDLTITEGPEGDKVAASTAGNIHSQLHYFFNYLPTKNLYPAVLRNPVARLKVKKRNKGATEDEILTPNGLQTWMDGARWEDITYIICSAKEMIRSDTIPLLQWSDVKREKEYIEISPEISKIGKASPTLTPEVLEMFEQFSNCKGPVVPQRITPSRARATAKALGVVKGDFHNHGRKSAISYRGSELEPLIGELNTVVRLEHEGGHSREVSEAWYRYRPKHKTALEYRKVKRLWDDIVISVYEARLYLTTQITGYARIQMELLHRDLQWNAYTDQKIVDKIMLRELKKAAKFFEEGPSLPTFVKIADPTVRILPLMRDDLRTLRLDCLPSDYLALMNKKVPMSQPTFFNAMV